MSLTSTIHDSLLYIDDEPSPSDRLAAQSLIDAELSLITPPSDHPSLPPLCPSSFSPAILAEHARLEVDPKSTLTAIDKSRYESPSAPSASSSTETWRAALRSAYTTHAYLSLRTQNLTLLSEFGKNAWLVGNAGVEDVLRGLEREVQARKEEIDRVVIERQEAQGNVQAEVRGLQEGWRRGVGRILETEVEAERVRREVLERRREGAR